MNTIFETPSPNGYAKKPQRCSSSEMVLIPAGEFSMGSMSGAEFERPVTTVDTGAFYLDQSPVTNAQFRRFVEASGHVTGAETAEEAWGFDGENYRMISGLNWRNYDCEGRVQHPVVLVNWFDASAFANWIGKRLPTEAEWEKAAQGGIANDYPWGNVLPDGTQSIFAAQPAKLPPTRPVGCYAPNAYGVFDMVGHVWQWCSDWFNEETYTISPHKNPCGPSSGSYKVRRGGAWNVIQAFRLRSANRGAMDPAASAPNIGFRCALDPY